ncbi:MAG: MFS transporter [Desulfovibrionaceae bacterium]
MPLSVTPAPQAPKGPDDFAAPMPDTRARLVLLTVCIAQFMAPFMLTAIGVSLPALGRELGANAVQLGLIEQLYVVSLAMGMLPFGRLGDLVGQKRVFLPGLALFTVMTTSLGLTQSVHMIMVQRFIQGIGACMMLSGSLALVAGAYPAAMRGRVIGIVSAFTYAGLSVGPVFGGLVTDHLGWRWVYLTAAPIGAAGVIAALYGLRTPPRADAGETMDWRGSLVYASAVALFMLGSAHATAAPWGPVMIAAGLVGGAAFLWLQGRTRHPLLAVSLLRSNRFFTFSSLAALGNYAATFGVTFSMSLYLQYVRGMSSRAAGMVLLISPVLQIFVAPMAGRLADRFPLARLATTGMLCSGVGLLLMAAVLGPDTPLWMLAGLLALMGVGFGIFITPNSTAIMSSLPPRQYGLASGMTAAMRTLGMAVSMTSVTLIFALILGEAVITPDTAPAFLSSMRTALVVFAVYSCLGIVLSAFRGRKI